MKKLKKIYILHFPRKVYAKFFQIPLLIRWCSIQEQPNLLIFNGTGFDFPHRLPSERRVPVCLLRKRSEDTKIKSKG
jgi:hypothetical protein